LAVVQFGMDMIKVKFLCSPLITGANFKFKSML